MNSPKVLISGATGWLGQETIARVLEEKFDNITASELILSSSDGRELNLGTVGNFPTVPLKSFSGVGDDNKLNGFIHLAFLTRDKIERYGFNNFVAKNIELISAACEIIERDKPKWVVLVSSGAIIDRETLEIENNVTKNPYGFCKRIEEALISEAAQKVGANIVIGRLWGGTGLHMPINRAYAISDFIESAKETKEIGINSGGQVIRRYCDAGDFMEVLIRSAMRGDSTTVDSGGSIIELGELAESLSAHMGGVSISRSEKLSATDDYYPRGMEFEELANSLGVQIHGFSEQVLRTLKSHKAING